MSKKTTNKETIKIFKSSLKEVSKSLNVPCHLVKRDEYIRYTVDNNVKRLNKVQLNELGGFAAARGLYFPTPKLTKEELEQILKEETESNYVKYVSTYGITPSLKKIKDWGYTAREVNKLFGSMRGLYDYVSEKHPEIVKDLVNDSIFTKEYFEQLKKKVKKKKKFIIFTAVSGKEVLPSFLDSIKTFNEVENAMAIVQPCEDVASRNSIFDYELDKRLREFDFAFKDLYLNDKIFLSSIKVSAKQINPLTGLERFAQAKGSMILASTKQSMQFVANSNVKMPRSLMTSGAVTIPDYSTDKSMSKRTSYIAEFDHKIGAVIVEIENDKVFHFRQVQANPDGSFYDLGWKYSPDGTVQHIVDENVGLPKAVFGDTHAGSHCPYVNKCLKEIVYNVGCDEAVVHDLFDNRFNNHHDMSKPVTRANIARQGKSSMMGEGQITADWLNEWSNEVDKITIVKSNHDEALDRYIDEGRWKDDPENLYDALDLVKVRMDGGDPLKFLVQDKIGLEQPEKINWLGRDEDYKLYGIENGSHGDKAGNGSRGSLKAIEKNHHKATVGHSHTAGILREVFQVGTSTHLKLSYNTGPSSWTNTMCIQYPTGTRQLVNIIKTKDGKISWKLDE